MRLKIIDQEATHIFIRTNLLAWSPSVTIIVIINIMNVDGLDIEFLGDQLTHLTENTLRGLLNPVWLQTVALLLVLLVLVYLPRTLEFISRTVTTMISGTLGQLILQIPRIYEFKGVVYWLICVGLLCSLSNMHTEHIRRLFGNLLDVGHDEIGHEYRGRIIRIRPLDQDGGQDGGIRNDTQNVHDSFIQ